ncbi:MAG TPA: response regulator [Symbiobacteriaceae bacterium]|nr:response regulator [Symbiobacteriaceae bacterium]
MTDHQGDLRERLLATFKEESQEHLQTMRAGLLTLQKRPARSESGTALESTFRAVHTLKGAARAVNLSPVEALCQALEAVLRPLTRDELELSGQVLHLVHEAVAILPDLFEGRVATRELEEMVGRLRSLHLPAAGGGPAFAVPSVQFEATREPRTDTIRVSTDKLDALLLQTEELLLAKLAASERVREAKTVRDLASRAFHSSDESASPDPKGLQAQAQRLLTHLSRDEWTITRSLDALQDEVRRIRMSPASTVLDLVPGVVHDLAHAQGKLIDLAMHGAELEVDRKVLETIKAPLIHMLRNAVDHGIELPQDREAAGKPPRGRISVSCAHGEGNRIVITVEDDGRGIDPALVRDAALRGRVVSPEEVESLGADEIVQLVFRSGLSTSPMITNVSGHGLGLPIVKEQAEQLRGQVHLQSQAGQGTTVRLVLPATVATFRGLLLRAAGQSFLLPIEAVEQAIFVQEAAVQTLEGRPMLMWNGRLLPYDSLGRLLELREAAVPPEPSARPCLIVKGSPERVAIMVDEVLGDREVLVKPLNPPLVRVRNIGGAGLLGSGEVVLILRPADLIRSIRAAARPQFNLRPATAPETLPVILVVDDSITTRVLEKSILEAAGYQVRVAMDGIDAWTILKSEHCDLVVSDVDMPRLDGCELTARIRADATLADLPVILVTALESRDDKERGIAVGANAYVVKSSFDQSNLLEIVRRLL